MSDTPNKGLKALRFDSSKLDPVRDYLNNATQGIGTGEHQDFNHVGHFLLDYPHGEYVSKVIEQTGMEAPSVDRYEFNIRSIGSSREIVYVLEDGDSSILIGDEDCLSDLLDRDYLTDSLISEIGDWFDEFFGPGRI